MLHEDKHCKLQEFKQTEKSGLWTPRGALDSKTDRLTNSQPQRGSDLEDEPTFRTESRGSWIFLQDGDEEFCASAGQS
jgi:hypothetical protein